MKIVTIVGARPQFIKAAMISKAIADYNRQYGNRITEMLLHTGQHYDADMSSVFFKEMNIPMPTFQLDCQGDTHGKMTGNMLIAIEKVILDTCPDFVLVYGDTNSTLAGALAAVKQHVPVAHVEAGLRSFNKKMPEEINRIVTDHISSQLFCPTSEAAKNLRNEGISENVHHCGDVMYDAAIFFGKLAEKTSTALQQMDVKPKSYYLATVHRAENTDNRKNLADIFSTFNQLACKDHPVVLPLHPRTRKMLEEFDLLSLIYQNPYLRMIPPVGFLDIIMLEKNAAIILTDSGGIQKEACFYQTPCITLREETEWVETVASGWNRLAGHNRKAIVRCASSAFSGNFIEEYGQGDAAQKIIAELCR
ncbi:MAG: UDP-N-acetylglucosamine 2-epimerase (non-hydrolyzing) [Bacteroidales bacterium]|jgi:UDP-GlcNAc3NAcA epimerase|nr:UDP-N-acetylglucosamine 2-epimerase (non-hydrolyzing) [Bacteroidales bacterium]